jgi:hypothetical protein
MGWFGSVTDAEEHVPDVGAASVGTPEPVQGSLFEEGGATQSAVQRRRRRASVTLRGPVTLPMR